MKLTKFAFTAVLMALTVWTSGAQIIPGDLSKLEKINFSLTLKQQIQPPINPASTTWTVKTVRMGNKELLNYLAAAFHTNWPDGAQLAVWRDPRDYDPYRDSREIYIVDKAGNPLWNCSWGYYLNETNYAYFNISCSWSTKVGNYVNQWPLQIYNVTHSQIITFHLYRIDDDWSYYTDLSLQGPDTEKYSQKTVEYTTTTTRKEHADLYGVGPINAASSIVSGHVSIAGKRVDVF